MMKMNKYPIYVISKGRWRNGCTWKALNKTKVSYKVVIEPDEYTHYSKVIDTDKLLVLPFNNLGQGSIPARNWVWEHSITENHSKHWILDDNIRQFNRLNKNKKHEVRCNAVFRATEDFIDRYENIALSGLNYDCFCKESDPVPAYNLNTRVYSCILIDNNIPFRWRGRYNEDTDLSLRVLKAGYSTVLFNAFMCFKEQTMSMKGGNTDHVYTDGDNRLKFTKSLQEQHPDVVKVTWKFNRWHHQVDYSPFKKNKLIKKSGLNIPKGINNYGMKLMKISHEK